MRYGVIFVVVLLVMCIGQEESSELESGEEQIPAETLPPVPDDALKDMIHMYFEALNQRDATFLEKVTHPFYTAEVQPLLDYVSDNNISFEITSASMLMKENSFRREMMKTMTEEEFAQQIGRRGVSYELELVIAKQDKSYPYCFLFIEVGETEDGWKVLNPSIFQMVLEEYLEILESEE